jgi:hypothetical protein
MNVGIVLAALIAVGFAIASRPTARKLRPAATIASSTLAAGPVVAPEPPKTADAAMPAPQPLPAPEPPKLDRAAIAKAEAALDSASRDRERAEARADDASRRLAAASTRAALDASVAKNLAFRVRDPSTRISQAVARGAFLRSEREKLKGEIATLASVPRPKSKVLSNKNPVAKPADGDEHHFELRHNRVAHVDLDRLLTMVKADALLRIRLSDSARVIESRVGPVGAFSLQYTMARSLPGGIEELMERRGISYELRGWEVVPEFEGRGEPYAVTRQPISDYARAINRLTPSKATITMWVYPDGFALFRKLRDDLHARGFLVAARPLPEGMAIRGSPGGSLSAGQ